MSDPFYSDTGGIMLTLLEEVRELMRDRHEIQRDCGPVIDTWKSSGTTYISDKTVAPLLIDVYKSFVRTVHPSAHTVPEFTNGGDIAWAVWWLNPTGGNTVSPCYPTELQAWHSAHCEVEKEKTDAS